MRFAARGAWRAAAFVASIFFLAGCQGGSPVAPPTSPAVSTPAPSPDIAQGVRFGSPRGAAAIALAGLLGGYDLVGPFGPSSSLEFVGSPDQLVAQLASGQLDAALLPVNVAATLFNRTNGGIELAAITAEGLLYAVSNDPTVTSFSDLAGRNITAFGLGATPQFVIEFLSQYNNVAVDVDYTAEAPEAVAHLVSGQSDIGILPEPFVTSTLKQADDFQVAFSLNDAWLSATGSPLVTTALVFRTDWAAQHPELAQSVLEQVGESISWVKGHPASAAQILASAEILPNAAIAEAAIPRTNLVFLTGPQMRDITLEFLTVLHDANPESIGGQLPNATFFYPN